MQFLFIYTDYTLLLLTAATPYPRLNQQVAKPKLRSDGSRSSGRRAPASRGVVGDLDIALADRRIPMTDSMADGGEVPDGIGQ